MYCQIGARALYGKTHLKTISTLRYCCKLQTCQWSILEKFFHLPVRWAGEHIYSPSVTFAGHAEWNNLCLFWNVIKRQKWGRASTNFDHWLLWFKLVKCNKIIKISPKAQVHQFENIHLIAFCNTKLCTVNTCIHMSMFQMKMHRKLRMTGCIVDDN